MFMRWVAPWLCRNIFINQILFESCSHSGTSRNIPLRNSSSSSMLFAFSVSADPCNGFQRDSSLIISLLSAAGFSVLIRLSCDEDVEVLGEDDVEELVDRPGTTNGTKFDILQLMFLPFWVRCGFLTTGPMVCTPMIFAELPEWKNCRCAFKKHNCHEKVQFFVIYRGFFSGLHLAVGRHLVISNNSE